MSDQALMEAARLCRSNPDLYIPKFLAAIDRDQLLGSISRKDEGKFRVVDHVAYPGSLVFNHHIRPDKDRLATILWTTVRVDYTVNLSIADEFRYGRAPSIGHYERLNLKKLVAKINNSPWKVHE